MPTTTADLMWSGARAVDSAAVLAFLVYARGSGAVTMVVTCTTHAFFESLKGHPALRMLTERSHRCTIAQLQALLLYVFLFRLGNRY